MDNGLGLANELSSLSLDPKSPVFEPCSLLGSENGINVWRQGVATPEDCFSLPDPQACQSPGTFSLEGMTAQSSPTDRSVNLVPGTADMSELRESDLLNFFPEDLKSGPESAPSLGFISSAYMESLSSTDTYSPTLHTASVAHHDVATKTDAHQPVNQLAFADTATITSAVASQHLPGCPSGRHHLLSQHHAQVQQAPSMPVDWGQYRHHVTPIPCSHHCAVSPWQSAQHVQHDSGYYHPQAHHVFPHGYFQQTHNPTNGQHHNIMSPDMFQRAQTHHRLTPESIVGQEEPLSTTEAQDFSTIRGHAIHGSSLAKHVSQGTSPAPSSINPEGSSITESELAQGRQSHHYDAKPRESDGKYHCFFEGHGDCDHQPTKLKCNYDKYIDSHLKPYKCNFDGCIELKFSSTACRLRHERESHGSHGHGQKPYLCRWEGCPRSRSDNGFPRSWNCSDHMKRVHGYKPSEASDDSESQRDPTPEPPSSPVSAKSTAAKKRENPVAEQADSKAKRQKGSTRPSSAMVSMKQNSKSPVKERSVLDDLDDQQKLHEEWRKRRLSAQQILRNLGGPGDTRNLALLGTEYHSMMEISQALAK